MIKAWCERKQNWEECWRWKPNSWGMEARGDDHVWQQDIFSIGRKVWKNISGSLGGTASEVKESSVHHGYIYHDFEGEPQFFSLPKMALSVGISCLKSLKKYIQYLKVLHGFLTLIYFVLKKGSDKCDRRPLDKYFLMWMKHIKWDCAVLEWTLVWSRHTGLAVAWSQGRSRSHSRKEPYFLSKD